MSSYVPWLTLALLGAFHGLNPGMGWLFAVALGLQERSRAVVVRALGPIAVGHAASIAFVVGLVGLSNEIVPTSILRLVCAAIVLVFGVYKLLAPMSHPKWVGMRVNARDLTAWSFLMSTAHGAGLMLVPILFGRGTAAAASSHAEHMGHTGHAEHMTTSQESASRTISDLFAVGIHTVAMFVIMFVIAIVIYDRVGLKILRRAWFNLDRIWAGALITAGALTIVLGA